MNALQVIAENAKKLDVIFLMRQLFINTEFTDLIIELNTIEQLYNKGIDSTGDSIGEYQPATIEGTSNFLGKKQKGQPYDRVTLKDTGEFYASFRTKWEASGNIIITADVLKDGTNLLEAWGRDILGLTEENLGRLRDKAIQILVPIIKRELLANAA